MTAIIDIHAREILDSRGNPTVEVEVLLEGGAEGRAAVPSGASTGAHEAVELRDGDAARYGGKGVLGACNAVNGEIFDAISGMDAREQEAIDQTMVDLDGTPNKARLGANATLGVSLAVAKAASAAVGQSLYRYVGGVHARTLPAPMMNVVNGGAHANNALDVQEFMIVPVGAANFAEAVRAGSEVFHALRKQLDEAGHSTSVGDEGGFAPDLGGADATLGALAKAVEATGRKLGDDMVLAIDAAATEFHAEGVYDMAGEGKKLDAAGMVAFYEELAGRYPIVSIEDGMAEDDWDGWQALTSALGASCNWSATTSSSPTRRGSPTASRAASPTPSWSRSTRSARFPKHSRPSRLHIARVMRRSCRTARARPRTRPSPISRSPPTAARSRPARCRARIDWPSTISSSASRKRSARWRATPAPAPSPASDGGGSA